MTISNKPVLHRLSVPVNLALPLNRTDMQIISSAEEATKRILAAKPRRIGFVPTMGCLHEGHLSLIKKSRSVDEITVCSIFINPVQFNNPDDFKKYPVTTEQDSKLLAELGCDILFLPSVSEIYPEGYQAKPFNIGSLDEIWEGEYRPGHFQGVCKVMDRLLDIIPADDLWMGQKDFQQCLVIQKLLELTNRPGVTFHMVNTIREKSGLAMSSRNTRLSKEGLVKAAALYEALQMINREYHTADFAVLQNKAKAYLLERGFEKVEYIAIALQQNLQPAATSQPDEKYVVLAAAWIENVRLIDNLVLQK